MTPPHPPRQSLATGFRDVDSSGDTHACQRCLDTIAGIPFFHEIKEATFRIIAATGPSRVLDAGCGSGTDLVTLSTILPAGCQLTGLDTSQSLLALASERTRSIQDRCSLVRGDITQIPVKASVFDACRIDRVLQHLHEPHNGIRELVRILRPGGTLVAFDNDWDTFSISLDDRDTVSRIRQSWRDSFASGRIGCDLPRFFKDSGLTAIHTEPRTLTLNDLALADQVFDLPDLLGWMVQDGTLAPDEPDSIREELCIKAGEGVFTSGYTGFLVWGTKPPSP